MCGHVYVHRVQTAWIFTSYSCLSSVIRVDQEQCIYFPYTNTLEINVKSADHLRVDKIGQKIIYP